ncbi:MAG: hypothetical protein J1G02_04350 [Clostridiales bacterium]|nr:hypothetical protein [Clostridiales bacterium]
MKKTMLVLLSVLMVVSCVLAFTACEKNCDRLGHEWGEWSVKTAPTCTEKGENVRKCSRCGAEDKQEVAALGHDFGEPVVVPATCGVAGTSTKSCSRCEVKDVTNIPATENHTWVADTESTANKAPTCTEKGVKAEKCSVCNATRTIDIPATDHDYSVWGHDALQHWKKCANDETHIDESTRANHVYDQEGDKCLCGAECEWTEFIGFYDYLSEDNSDKGYRNKYWAVTITATSVTVKFEETVYETVIVSYNDGLFTLNIASLGNNWKLNLIGGGEIGLYGDASDGTYYDVVLGLHEHDYSAVGKDADAHWNYCPVDNVEEPGSRWAHSFEQEGATKCACGMEFKWEYMYGVYDRIVNIYAGEDDAATKEWAVTINADGITIRYDGTDYTAEPIKWSNKQLTVNVEELGGTFAMRVDGDILNIWNMDADVEIDIDLAPHRDENVYSGMLDGMSVTITLQDGGVAVISPNPMGETHTYELNDNILTLIYQSGAKAYLELNTTDLTFIQLDAMYTVTYTAANDAVMSFDGKGGVTLDTHTGTYELLKDLDWGEIYGIKLVFGDDDYEVDFEGYEVGAAINVTITIDGTEYVFGTPASGGCDNPNCDCDDCDGDCNCGEESDGINVADVVGVWTNGSKKVVISTTVFDSYYVASIIIDGNMYIELYKSSDGSKLEGMEIYAYTYEDVTITYDAASGKLTVDYSGWTDGAVDFTSKDTIGNNADFTGVWYYEDWEVTFTIKEDEIINDLDIEDIDFIIVGDYMVMRGKSFYGTYHNDMFVVSKNGNNLKFYWYEEDSSDCEEWDLVYQGPVPDDTQAINVEDIVGIWTNSNGDELIISLAGKSVYYVGSIILNKQYVHLQRESNAVLKATDTNYNYIRISLGENSTLTVDVEGVVTSYTLQSSLNNTTIDGFVGNWKDEAHDKTIEISSNGTIKVDGDAVEVYIIDKYVAAIWGGGLSDGYIFYVDDDHIAGYLTDYYNDAVAKAVTLVEGTGVEDPVEDIDIADVVGVWTNSKYELVISTQFAKGEVVGIMIVNGTNVLYLTKDGAALLGEGYYSYKVLYDADSSTLTLVVLDNDSRETFTTHDNLSNDDDSDFEGSWLYDPYHMVDYQNILTINNGKVWYSDEYVESIDFEVVSSYLVVRYLDSYDETYSFVLSKVEDTLSGSYVDNYSIISATLKRMVYSDYYRGTYVGTDNDDESIEYAFIISEDGIEAYVSGKSYQTRIEKFYVINDVYVLIVNLGNAGIGYYRLESDLDYVGESGTFTHAELYHYSNYHEDQSDCVCGDFDIGEYNPGTGCPWEDFIGVYTVTVYPDWHIEYDERDREQLVLGEGHVWIITVTADGVSVTIDGTPADVTLGKFENIDMEDTLSFEIDGKTYYLGNYGCDTNEDGKYTELNLMDYNRDMDFTNYEKAIRVTETEQPCEHDYEGQPYVSDEKGNHYQLCKNCEQPGETESCEGTWTYGANGHIRTCDKCSSKLEEVGHTWKTTGGTYNSGAGTHTVGCTATACTITNVAECGNKTTGTCSVCRHIYKPTNTWIVVGKTNGTNWDPNSSKTELTFVWDHETATYKLTISFASADEFKFKVKQSTWGTELAGNKLTSVTFADGVENVEGLFSGSGNITVKFDCTVEITLHATFTNATPSSATIRVTSVTTKELTEYKYTFHLYAPTISQTRIHVWGAIDGATDYNTTYMTKDSEHTGWFVWTHTAYAPITGTISIIFHNGDSDKHTVFNDGAGTGPAITVAEHMYFVYKDISGSYASMDAAEAAYAAKTASASVHVAIVPVKYELAA